MYPEHDPVTARAQARVGTLLRDKWRLDALLGVGGMAAVYAATHRNSGRGAIKILHAELSVDPEVRARFLREGYAANTVGHPGAVRVFDDDTLDDGSVFLVMELLEGESLESRRVRSGGRMPAPEVFAAADQLLDVLVAAHAKGIIHRDLKPDNVFVTIDGQIKILDFGIAKLRASTATSGATRTGSPMGTPAFMPPEQARGRWELVDARSDIWAVGATMYTLLTGRMVHEAETVNEQLLAAMTIPARSVSEAEVLPTPLVTVVDRALAFEASSRWPDAAAMQEAVREAYHAIFRAPITTAPKLSSPPPKDASQAASASPASSTATTGGAIAVGRTGVGATYAPTQQRLIWGGVAALALMMALAVAIFAASSRGTKGASAAQSSSASTPAAPSTQSPGTGTEQLVEAGATPSSRPVPDDTGAKESPAKGEVDAGRKKPASTTVTTARPPEDIFERRK